MTVLRLGDAIGSDMDAGRIHPDVMIKQPVAVLTMWRLPKPLLQTGDDKMPDEHVQGADERGGKVVPRRHRTHEVLS